MKPNGSIFVLLRGLGVLSIYFSLSILFLIGGTDDSHAKLIEGTELTTSLKYNPDALTHEDLQHEVYIYQNQAMEDVSWFYAGLAPRVEDPKRIEIVFSKSGYTMRVTLQLTAEEVANYPRYLVSRAQEVANIFSEMKIQIFPEKRNQGMFENYLARLTHIQNKYVMLLGFNQRKFSEGLELLQNNFPQNVFLTPSTKSELQAHDIAVTMHLVYPITIHKSGNSFPADGVYIQSEHYKSHHDAINERRTEYNTREKVDTDGDGVHDKTIRKLKNHIFSGFPAFWLDALGAGTGVHGPIRYSELDQRHLGQSGPYGRTPEEMARFWRENEFIKSPQLLPQADGATYEIQSKMRWDVVRTNDSNGCFRAETLELRHILPSDPRVIYTQIRWKVITEIDQITLPGAKESRFVDIDYYMVNPYRFPLSREKWIEERILSAEDRRSRSRDEKIQDFIDRSIQFPYLDPANIEIIISPEQGRNRGMQKLNRANGTAI